MFQTGQVRISLFTEGVPFVEHTSYFCVVEILFSRAPELFLETIEIQFSKNGDAIYSISCEKTTYVSIKIKELN